MALNDKFRIDELVKKGDRGVRRDDSGKIVVRRKDGNEIKPLPKSPKPFGEEKITGKQVKDKLKEDLVYRDDEINPNQETFGGESVIKAERPNYDKDELVKAIDVEVDELLKKQKPKGEKYVLETLYNKKLQEITNLNQELQTVSNERDELLSNVETLEGDVEVLNQRIVSLETQLSEQELQLQELTTRFGELSLDFQNAVIKGTREGIERVSLTAQSRGLEAQKETLQSQLDAEKEIVKSLQAANETLQQTIETNSKVFEAQLKTMEQQVKAAQNTATTAANSKKKKIICNELYHQGFIPQLIWDADERYGDMMFDKDPRLVIGYQMWARKVVEFMRRKPQYSPIVNFFVKPWTEWMAHQMGVLPKSNLRGYLTHLVGKQVCYIVYDFNGGDKLYQRYLNSN